MNLLRFVSDYLVIDSPVKHSDLIFVLAGMPERKRFGLTLYHQGLASRIIFSIGRYEVRHAASLIPRGAELQRVRDSTPPQKRHFFVDCWRESHRVTALPFAGQGTYCELAALSNYLNGQEVRTLTMVSTSIHLRRVRYCCRKLPFFSDKEISYLAVPEFMSSFHRERCWNHYRDWRYLVSEYFKLAGYFLVYRNADSGVSLAQRLPPE